MSQHRRVNVPSLRPGAFGGSLGLVVVAAGLLVIGIGWNRAAGAGGDINGIPTLSAQLPWLLSGGILGLGLVVFGAALLVLAQHSTHPPPRGGEDVERGWSRA